MSLLARVAVPAATEADAEQTCAALAPYLDEIDAVVGIHVIEKAGGAIDKAPLEKRQEDAAELLAVIEARLGDRLPVETRVAYGTDVAETLYEEALAADASAIVFVPRGGSRLVRLIAGDTTTSLIVDASLPVVALPVPDQTSPEESTET